MKKKGFTLIELLVVIAIIAMLLAILMPALNKVKRLAQRLVCATNLKGLGTAFMVYSNDDRYEQYPLSRRDAPVDEFIWALSTKFWYTPDKDWSAGGNLTVSSNLYLLVREADVDPKTFVCKSSDQRAYEGQAPSDPTLGRVPELVELWDFGKKSVEDTGSANCVSYASQHTFAKNPTSNPPRPSSSTAPASMALLADKSPWYDSLASDIANDPPDPDSWISEVGLLGNNGDDDDYDDQGLQKYEIQVANSFAHNREGQNVLFNDGHAEFTKRSDVGVQNDNIYTPYSGAPSYGEGNKRVGKAAPGNFDGKNPRDSKDTYLVNDDLPL